MNANETALKIKALENFVEHSFSELSNVLDKLETFAHGERSISYSFVEDIAVAQSNVEAAHVVAAILDPKRNDGQWIAAEDRLEEIRKHFMQMVLIYGGSKSTSDFSNAFAARDHNAQLKVLKLVEYGY
jgi:hypothetical protein